MATEVGTSVLNYTEVKQKALSSKLIRTIRPSSNSTSFTMGQTINFETEANAEGMYLDAGASYMKFIITNNSASSITIDNSAYGLINRLMITTAGQTICDLQHYNVLMNALMGLNVGGQYVNNIGKALMGAGGDANLHAKGATLTNGQSIQVCLPLALSPLSMTQPHRYIYCGARSPFQYKLTLDDANVAFLCEQSVANGDVAISDFEVVFNYVQLNSEAQQQVNAMVGGKYNVLCSEFVNFQTTLSANVTALSFPLGIARSSLDRVLVIHRRADSSVSFDAYSLSNRTTANIQSTFLSVAGQSIPQRKIEAGVTTLGKYSSFMAEALVANHDLTNMDHQASIYQNGVTTDNFELLDGVGAAAANVGSFVYSIETESLAYNSEKAFSGINTIGQSVFLTNTYTNSHVADIVDVFAQSTVLLSLDMNGSGVYAISV